ncbi:hypothetical protein EPUL_006343, partial [Erysiphe pulchra]
MASIKTEDVSLDTNTPFVRTYVYPERVPVGNGVSAAESKEAWIKAEQAKEERARIRQMDRERFRIQQEKIKTSQKREWDMKADSEVERDVTGKVPIEKVGFTSNPWANWTAPPPG